MQAERGRFGTALGAVGTCAFLLVAAGLLLIPVGGSSKSSELLIAPYLPRSAHHAYAYSLALGRLSRPPALDWLIASERALLQPERVELPLERDGAFEPQRPAAVGISVEAQSGRRVHIDVEAMPGPGAAGDELGPAVFVELFDGDVALPALLDGGAPDADGQQRVIRRRIEVAVLEPSRYVLRVQPELGYAGRYRISVRTAPLLTFPVEGMDTRAIQSGFGAERDGGARSHRGVDIFAPRGTPAVAAMDSWVVRVETTRRGGNVVWLQPLFDDMRLYYAHLDTQLVRPGDFVLAGETVGTVGNTGNAVTTPPHLHFGVYLRRRGMRGGARDPYPFLD